MEQWPRGLGEDYMQSSFQNVSANMDKAIRRCIGLF